MSKSMMEQIRLLCNCVASMGWYEEYVKTTSAEEVPLKLYNETLAFSCQRNMELSDVCDMLEVLYLAQQLKVIDLSGVFLEYLVPVIKKEGELVHKFSDQELKALLLNAKREFMFESVLDAIESENKYGRQVILQDRLRWEFEEFQDKVVIRRRLGVLVCEKAYQLRKNS